MKEKKKKKKKRKEKRTKQTKKFDWISMVIYTTHWLPPKPKHLKKHPDSQTQ